MIAPEENLSCRVYNVAGMSFTPDILYNEVKKHVPNLAIEYNIDDRQKIGKIQMEKKLNYKMESKYFVIAYYNYKTPFLKANFIYLTGFFS